MFADSTSNTKQVVKIKRQTGQRGHRYRFKIEFLFNFAGFWVIFGHVQHMKCIAVWELTDLS